MELTELRIIETAIAIAFYFVMRFVVIKSIDRTVTQRLLHKTRGKIIKKISNLLVLIIVLIFILTVWGVDHSELFVFMASVLTVIGIALFAQWSLLSNITSGIILFFSYTIKLDDTISILDKDYQIEGRISDIGLFFIRIKTIEGEEVMLPNNIFMQKMIKKRKA